MSCDAERVTAYVDGLLADDPQRLREAEEHIASCDVCRRQADEERTVAARLRSLPLIEPAPQLEFSVRRALRRERTRQRLRWTLPFAAGLALAALWAHGWPPFVAQELAWDHRHCFGKPKLPAQVWSSEPETILGWFEEHDASIPLLPEAVGTLELVGARRCPLLDRRVAHLYYGDRERRLSVFVVPGYLRMPSSRPLRARGTFVRIVPVDGRKVAVVSEDEVAVEAFARRLTTTMALLRHDSPMPFTFGAPPVAR